MIRTIAFPVLAAALALAPAAARADRRYYGETYTASVAPRGSLDLELWSTFQDAPRNGSAPAFWTHQLELETGITDHWDVAVYNIARQIQGQNLEYEAVKVETRVRLSDPGAWFVDPVLYFEVKKTFVDDKPLSIEEKLILSKDVGRLNMAVNLAAEQEFVPGASKVEHEGEWAAGASWEIVPAFRAGAEAFGTVARADEEGPERFAFQTYAGPAVSIAWGRAWLVLAAGVGLNDQSERVRARAIFSYQLF
jgi:hypothetical protein